MGGWADVATKRDLALRSARWRWATTGAVVVYLAVVLWGTLGPAPGDEVRAVGRTIVDAGPR